MPVARNVRQQVAWDRPACRAQRLVTPHLRPPHACRAGADATGASIQPKVPPLSRMVMNTLTRPNKKGPAVAEPLARQENQAAAPGRKPDKSQATVARGMSSAIAQGRSRGSLSTITELQISAIFSGLPSGITTAPVRARSGVAA